MVLGRNYIVGRQIKIDPPLRQQLHITSPSLAIILYFILSKQSQQMAALKLASFSDIKETPLSARDFSPYTNNGGYVHFIITHQTLQSRGDG